jgi:molybdopterin converting factor subunit 1
MEILAFGIVKDIFLTTSIDLIVDEDITVGALKQKLEGRYPQLRGISSYMVAVNDEYASDDSIIKNNDEVAIIPPVSGG